MFGPWLGIYCFCVFACCGTWNALFGLPPVVGGTQLWPAIRVIGGFDLANFTSGCAVALWLPTPRTVFVLSFPISRTEASVNMVGFTEGLKSLTSAEHCPSCIDCTVITGAETDACWCTDGTLIDDATFSASSVLSIQSETFVKLSSGD